MRILLVNDDGIAFSGISVLVRALSPYYALVVTAPAAEQSGKSHAITVRQRIEIERYRGFSEAVEAAWKIHGTPADCVKIYLEAMISEEEKPDLVISGINEGANLGTDVIYFGTVGAAMEGYMHQIPALAVSLDIHSELSYDRAARYCVRRVLYLHRLREDGH